MRKSIPAFFFAIAFALPLFADGTGDAPKAKPAEAKDNKPAATAETSQASSGYTWASLFNTPIPLSEKHPAFQREKYLVVSVGPMEYDHGCTPLLGRGDSIGHSEEFRDDLDATGWQVGLNYHAPISTLFDLDTAVSFSQASIDDGTIIHDGDFKAFDDSDCQVFQGHVLFQRALPEYGIIRPYIGAGVQFFFSKADYDRCIRYRYSSNSGTISKQDRIGGGGSIDESEIAPCINLGVELFYADLVARLDVSYSTGMKDIWRKDHSGDEENLVLSADCRYPLSDDMFLQVGLSEFKATAVRDFHVGLGTVY